MYTFVNRRTNLEFDPLPHREPMQLVANFQEDRIEFPLTENQASRGTKDRLQH